jgi:hypothetical protein
MHARVAAYEAWSHGFDVLRNANPLDPMHRVSTKPTWGLPISSLGMHRDGLAFAGSAVIVSCLTIFITLIRPQRWTEMCVALLLVCSPGIMLGIERANDDLVYFSLLALVPLALRVKGLTGYWLAWLIIFLIAPAKFYPGAAFTVLLVDMRGRRLFGSMLSAGIVFIALYVFNNWDELMYLSQELPQPLIFLCNGLSIPFTHLAETNVVSLILGFLLFLSVVVMAFNTCRVSPESDASELPLWTRYYYILGSSTYTFCFILNSNYDYRFILLIFTLPVLLNLAFRNAMGSAWASVSRLVLIGLVIVFWADIVAYHAIIRTSYSGSLQDALFVVSILKNILLIIIMFPIVGLSGLVLRPFVGRCLMGKTRSQ